MDIYLFNSLSRKKEKFVSLKKDFVGMYTCGPTVYDYATIGNFRTYTMSDVLLRVLKYNGYQVKYIMNLTDVGHLTGDNSGDADVGEDRMQKKASLEGKNAWDVAKFYIDAFFKDFEKLNLIKPENFVKATDHIQEQIDLVGKLEERGLIYKTSDGVYFDTQKFEESTGKNYGELSTLDRIKEGARVEKNPEKKNPRDFALWKFSPKDQKRDMEWQSPWGTGFPGWHIECSAMSMKYLGESFDIHTGGEDLRSTHHPNEIAQSEGATGEKFVNYWVHTSFLRVDGGRMGKSLGNAYRISDLENKGYDPLDLRYFYLSGKYNEPINFSWESLDASRTALNKLRGLLDLFKSEKERSMLSQEKLDKVEEYRERFLEKINDDLNTPQALAVLWELTKSNVSGTDKYDLILEFDEVLGLKLNRGLEIKQTPEEIKTLIDKRNLLRKGGDFEKADEIRKIIEGKGFNIRDEKII